MVLPAVLLLLACASNAFAQKGKIKGEPTQMSADTNSVNGKAALRGGTLMKASGDSLQASPIAIPSTVVDTFLPGPKPSATFTLTKASDFQTARKRILEAENDLADAAKALALASASGKYSDAALEERAANIKMQSEHLNAISKRLTALEQQWTVGRGPIPPLTPKEPAKVSPPPVTPSPKGGLGKQPTPTTPLQPASKKLK
jgi:hypothetical protein